MMDIDGTVKKLMDAERMPLNKLKAQKQIMEWQTQQYRDMNLLMEDLRNSLVTGLGLQSTFQSKAVVSSNESAVSASSKGSTVNSASTINSITNLANPASYVSGSLGASITLNSKLTDINAGIGTPGLKITVTNPDGTIKDTVSSPITIDANETVSSFITKINNANLGITAYLDEGTHQLVFTQKNTGSGAKIDVSDAATNDFFTKLNFNPTTELSSVVGTGLDASFTLNGLATTRKTNTFTVGDVTYTLKQTSASPITITSSTDTQKIFDSIKSFVDKYNNLIDKVNSKVSEKRYRDYQPLTDEQREAMKDDQITKWEEKAQSGLIRSDNVLTGVLNKMRLDLSTPVGGLSSAFKVLSDIGITTSSNYLERGKLVINETKLKDAINNDPSAVANLFAANGTTSSDQGFAVRIKDSLKNAIDNITKKAGKSTYVQSMYTLGRDMTDLDKRINKFEGRLIQIEDRYYRQFTAMERAIERANAQSSQFMNSFGG